MTITHDLIAGKLHVYRRENSRFWQCSSYLAGRNHRATTKTDNVERAKAFAEEWYFDLQVQHRSGELRGGKSFQAAADQFLREYEALTVGESHGDRLRVHLLPFFGNKSVSDITPGLVQEYRIHRMTSRKDEKTGLALRPARSTLHHEIVTLRQVLKTAQRHGWVKFIPDLSPPYKTSGKISHRAWFSPEEYKRLYEATRRRAAKPPRPRWKWQCEQMHDYVLFMVNTGLRPDEGSRLEFRDVEIVEDGATGETILEISVRGKRGVGYCKSMPGAVLPFERLRDRLRPKTLGRSQSRQEAEDAAAGWTKPGPMDQLFPTSHRELFNALLDEEELKKDREGLPRTAYSLRHTYICLRLMEGADIYQIAKNCRTSVEMIEKFYAAHIKNMIDAAAVNVRRAATPAAPKERPNGRTPRAGANAKSVRTRRKPGYPKVRR
jgi:integrase